MDLSEGPVTSLELQPSETEVYAAASRLLAGLLAAGRVTQETQDDSVRYCVETAIQLALAVDRAVQSEDEATGLGAREGAA
jgi:hypothetical protein